MSTKKKKMAAEFDVTPIQVFQILRGENIPEAKSPLQICKMKTPSTGQSTDKRGSANYSEASKSSYQPSSKGKSQQNFETTVVLSLPCDSPSAKSCFRIRRRHQLQKPTRNILKGEKEKLLDHAVQNGTEYNSVNGKMIPAKRKRGRPCGSKTKSTAVNVPNGEQTKVANIDSHIPISILKSVTGCPSHPVKSVGSAHEAVFKDFTRSGIRSKRGRKVRPTMDIIAASQEVQSLLPTIIEGGLASTITTVTEQEGIIVPISGDDMPLSTCYQDKYSPLAIDENTESSPVTHASKNDEVVEEDQVLEPSSHQLMKQTTITSFDVCPSTKEKENEMVDTVTNCLPFLKSSPLWEVMESMSIFKQLPQNPHFNPLYNCKEQCREGLAIGNMVTFAGLAEKISKFQFGEPKTILESSMDTLLELETQGFNIETVREKLNSLLLIKNGHESFLNQSIELENLVAEQRKVKEKLDAEVIQIDQKIADLREIRKLVLLASQRKESEMGVLISDMERWRKSMESAQSEFERVTTAPWL